MKTSRQRHWLEDLSVLCPVNHLSGTEWVAATGKTPSTFIFSGGTVDEQGRVLYVCRASIKGEMASGKVLFSKGRLGQCKLPYHGKEVSASNYDVLISPPWDDYELKWSNPINVFGKIPSNSVQVASGTYVGRYKENKHCFLGKVKYDHIARLFFYIVDRRECFRKRGYQVVVKQLRPIKRYEVLDVEYDLSQASQILSPEYVTLAHKNVRNDSPFDTTSTFSVEITDSTTREWSVTAGLEMHIGTTTSVTAGIPSLGEVTAGWEIGFTATFSFTHGESFTSSVATTHEVSADLPPYSKARVAVIAKKATVNVPYRATVKVVFENGHTHVNQDVKGIYKDVHYTSFETSVEIPTPEKATTSGTASDFYLPLFMGLKVLASCMGIWAFV
ncbi:Natterin-4 [Holothuria leucospilota]|uniref:Natterin-4 n=1 Tax=Holothuria leucospilota TaxID=206669 RepID=A0A9Q0YR19_HOLLE|nr:Natterin-4 [Holothuria leucospilota]